MRLLSLRTVLLATMMSSMGLSACTKDGSKENEGTGAYKEIEKTFDETETPAAERKPVQGVTSSELDKHLEVRFEALADKLVSPCGKAHSLRTSRNTDADCKRAPFAVEYVFELVKDGATDGEIKDNYGKRFRKSNAHQFKITAETPHSGATDAPVKIVEFFDYGCPACKGMKPVLEEVLAELEGDVVIYYKQFPLSAHPDSQGAAQAALAANKQGKFKEMHELLFADQHAHKVESLNAYAGKIGVDMGQWKKDYAALGAVVDADKAEGEAVGVSGTPAIYINGRSYEGPYAPKYIKMWIAEAAAEAI